MLGFSWVGSSFLVGLTVIFMGFWLFDVWLCLVNFLKKTLLRSIQTLEDKKQEEKSSSY